MLKIVDVFKCDLGDIKADRKAKFIQDTVNFTTEGEHPIPQLVVRVAATHAGLMTRNKAFYRPDSMRGSLDTFLKPFAKPVQVHHSDHIDPVGRVRGARYIDISHKYTEPLLQFKAKFGGTTFVDSKADTEKAFDQVKWVLKNLHTMRDYEGLGYGELDLHISDAKTATKILDERYLTVSVGFSTTEAYCSQCKQDWASNDGPCEHRPGDMVDGLPIVLIPSNFLYEEVSWVNNPADPFAKVSSIIQTGPSPIETVSASNQETHDFNTVVPILLGVSGGGIYRLDSYKEVDDRATETLVVTKKDKTSKPEPKLIEFDGSQFPEEAQELISNTDAKRENWITDEVMDHKHRAIIDPATGNGYTDWVGGHSHEVMNRSVKEGGEKEWDEEKSSYEMENAHSHSLKEKTSPLTDETKDSDEMHDEPEMKEAKKKKKARKSTCNTENEEVEEKEFDEDAELPEGWEWIDETIEFEKLSSEELASMEITDAVIEKSSFYDTFIAPIVEEIAGEDAKLSSAQRKKLSGSQFCGPGRSFPVPDCAHVTAARRLIGRYKGGNKKSILACVNRKARSLGCDKSSDSIDPLEVPLKDPQDTTVIITIGDIEDFKVAVHTLGKEMFDINKDKLYEVGKILGLEPEQIDKYIPGQPPDEVPLDELTTTLETQGTFELNDTFVSNLVSHIKNMEEVAQKDFLNKLHTSLIEANLLPDYDQEFNDLVEENENLKLKISRLLAINKDLYVGRQSTLAETIIQIKESLKKPGFEGLDQEARTTKISELRIRNIDSLTDNLRDLISEISGANEKPKELDAAVQPGSLTLKEPDETKVVDKSKLQKNQIAALKDLDEFTYQLARKLKDNSEKSLL